MSVGKYLGAFPKRKHPHIKPRSSKRRSMSKKALMEHERKFEHGFCVSVVVILAFVVAAVLYGCAYRGFYDSAKIDPSRSHIFYSH